MPLSEEEMRLLEQMERALVEEDPKFASTLKGTTLRRAARRRAVLAGVALAGGIAVLMTGVITTYWWLGIVGFLIMLGSATLLMSSLRGQRAADSGEQTAHPSGLGVIEGGRAHHIRRPRQKSHGSFMERMETRWRKRRDGGAGYF